jgi:hypothetical protein
MRFRGTIVTLIIAALLGGYVYWHEVVGGEKRSRARAAASRLLDLEGAPIEAIQVTHSGTQFVLQKKSDVWLITHPVQSECDRRVITAFLDTLVAARREDEVGRGDAQRYGLDAPAAIVEVRTAGGRSRKLQLGRINPQQTLVYARVDDSDEIVLTTAALLTQALNNSFGWRDKTMIDVQPELVHRIRLSTLVAPDLAIVRDPQHGWLVEGETRWRVDPVRAQGLLVGLSQLQAIGVAAEDKLEPQKWGIGNKRFSAALELADGKPIGQLVVGFALGDRSYYGVVPDKAEVFRIDGQLPDLMANVATDPRDREALPPFDLDEITQVRVSTPDDRFTLTRRSMYDWRLTESTRHDSTFAIDPGRMQHALTELSTMQLQDFPARQPPAALYDPPLITIHLYVGDRRVSGLELGRKDPHGLFTFARAPDEPAVFLLSPSVFLELPIDLERMRPDEEAAPEGVDRS